MKDSNSNYEYHVGGSVPVESSTYVEREADKVFYKSLKAGEFCYVLNSRQMGKSSLRLRIMQKLQKEDVVCTVIDLQKINITGLNIEQWYGGIVDLITRDCQLSIKFDDWWIEKLDILSPQQRFNIFIDEVLLREVKNNIVIFFEEIDRVLSLNFSSDDFFSLIRSFAEQKNNNTQYKRLTFALIGVASPSNLITDKNRTPFNIGKAIELDGFQLQEALCLTKGLEGKVNKPQSVLEEILSWTGGQPFLTQRICQLVARQADKSNFINEKSINKIIYENIIENWEATDELDHLKTIRNRLIVNEKNAVKLLELYREILQQGNIKWDGNPEQMQLRLSGIVVKRLNKLEIYNRIYETIFGLKWVDNTLSNFRPKFYTESITAWRNSGCRDKSNLLTGKKLQEAQKWSNGKSLSQIDYDFLTASRKLETDKNIRKGQFFLILTFVSSLIIIITTSFVAVKNINNAISARKRTLGLQLASKSFNYVNFIPDLSLLLNLEAFRIGEITKDSEILENTEMNILRILGVDSTRSLNTILREHSMAVRSLDISPDGKMLASGGDDKKIFLWNVDTDTYEKLNELKIDGIEIDNAVIKLAFKPKSYKSKILAIADRNKVVLWDITKGQLVSCVEVAKYTNNRIIDLSFSPNGQILAVASSNKVFLWKVNTEDYKISTENCVNGTQLCQLIHTTKEINPQRFKERVWSVAFVDDKTIASGREDGTISIWNITTKKELYSTQEHSGITVASLASIPNKKILASGGKDNIVKLWKWNGEELSPLGESLTGHKNWVHSLDFNSDGKILASGSWDSTIILWDITNPQVPQQITEPLIGHRSFIGDLAFNPQNSKMLLSAGADNNIIAWNLKKLDSFKIPTKIVGKPAPWVSIGYDPESLSNYSNFVTSIAISPDRKKLAAGTGDGSIILWDLVNSKQLDILKDNNEVVWSVAFSSDSRMLASGGEEGIILWNVNKAEKQHEFPKSDDVGRIDSLAFSPKQNHILASSGDREPITLWDTNENRLLKKFPHESTQEGLYKKGFVKRITFSGDGKMIASGHGRGFALWDVKTGSSLSEEGDVFTEAIAFSSDDKLLLTGDHKQEIHLWDIKNRKKIEKIGGSLSGHSSWVMSVAFKPNDEGFFSMDFEGTILYWRIDNAKVPNKRKTSQIPHLLANPNTSWTRAMALSNDGLTLATGGGDGTVFLSDLRLLSESFNILKQRICSITNRSLTKDEWQEYFGNAEYDPVCSEK